MPVWVRGNIASETLVIYIHGGPGGTSFSRVGLESYELIEDHFGMVYWEQRASGASQGNVSTDELEVSDFVEDLDKLIDLLNHQYNSPSIFLMGHSWGGGLGTEYLLDADRQAKVSGWIEVDGSHNNLLGDSLSVMWVCEKANDFIANGEDIDFWQYALDWYHSHPAILTSDLEHYTFVRKAGGYYVESANSTTYSMDFLLHSPGSLAIAFNALYTLNNVDISTIDLSNRMQDITLPSLIIWGEHDGIIPVPLAQDAYDHLGTPASDKSIILFDQSAHCPQNEEPQKFATAIIDFVNQYK